MAQRENRLPFLQDMRMSAARLQREGDRIVARFRHDALRLVERAPAVDNLLAAASVHKLRANARERAEHAMREMEARRTHLVSTVQEQLDRLADLIARGLNTAPRAEVDDLKHRVSRIEHQFQALREKREKGEAA